MEANKKYTPGPWKLVKVVQHPIEANEQIAFIQSSKVTCFDFSCVQSEEMSRDEFYANAELIARAPETAERLEQAEKEIEKVKSEYAELLIAFATRKMRLEEAIELLTEGMIQLRYVDSKFKPTGTSHAVISRIESFLAEQTKP